MLGHQHLENDDVAPAAALWNADDVLDAATVVGKTRTANNWRLPYDDGPKVKSLHVFYHLTIH